MCMYSPQNIEVEVNMNFPNSLAGDKYGRYLLCRQIRRLQVSLQFRCSVCVHVCVQAKKLEPACGPPLFKAFI